MGVKYQRFCAFTIVRWYRRYFGMGCRTNAQIGAGTGLLESLMSKAPLRQELPRFDCNRRRRRLPIPTCNGFISIGIGWCLKRA